MERCDNGIRPDSKSGGHNSLAGSSPVLSAKAPYRLAVRIEGLQPSDRSSTLREGTSFIIGVMV